MKRHRIILALALLAAATTPAQGQWSTPVRISEPGGIHYPQILAVGDTLHVVYTDVTFGGANVGYLRSADAGQTWSQPYALSDSINTGNNHYPRIMRYGRRLMTVWSTYILHGVINYNIGYSISNNDGLNWVPAQYVLLQNWPRSFPITVSNSDSLVVGMGPSASFTDSATFYCIRSTDFGQTWNSPMRIFTAAQSSRVDQASSGNMVHFIWSGRFNMAYKWEIRYLKSIDGGINWSSNIALSDSDQFHSQLPSIWADSGENLSLSWMDYKYTTHPTTGDIFLRQSSDSGEIWGLEEQITFNHFADISDVISNDDTIHIVWEDESQGIDNGKIMYIRSDDGGDTWDDPLWIDRTADESWNPAMAAYGGRLYAVWAEERDSPDTSGLFFSRWDPEPDAIDGSDMSTLPDEMCIAAYPNPFNSSVLITYTRSKGGDIEIINSLGQIIRKFEGDASGNGRVVWDGTDQEGYRVASGAYLIRLRAGDQSRTLKVVFVR
jgi:hypothetical protein